MRIEDIFKCFPQGPLSDEISPNGVSQHRLKVQKPEAFLWSPWRPQRLCWWMGKGSIAKCHDLRVWYHGTSMGTKRPDSVRTPPFYSIFQIKKVLIFTLNVRCQTSRLSPISSWLSLPPVCDTSVVSLMSYQIWVGGEHETVLFFPNSCFFVWKLTAVNQQFAALPPRCGVGVEALKGNQANLEYMHARVQYTHPGMCL